MARLTKDGSSRGQKSGAEFVSKPPLKILIIPAKELVQVTAQVSYFSTIWNVVVTKLRFLLECCMLSNDFGEFRLGEVAFNTLLISLLIILFVFQSWQDVAIARDGLPNESHHDMHQEIMVDSLISQSRHVEPGRELKPWVPDEDDPQCPELENIFDGHWNRLLVFYKIIL